MNQKKALHSQIMIKREILFSIGSLLLFISCTQDQIYNWNKSPYLIERYPKCNEQLSSPFADYDSLYKLHYICEIENNFKFPTLEAEYGKILYNKGELGGEFIHDKTYLKVDQSFIEDLRNITKDSSNFEWGELGTQYTGCIMEFYNSRDQLVNYATLTWGGMFHPVPYYKTTKWGALSDKGFVELFTLLEKYED